ncbi:unnamed protein product [Pieris macdunnoughi]|uniref:Peptidase S1 domain-containing protein n=1 Tax=Pieris macdunnoughi TaxID=345717 RepID=A0A821XJN0_9NEOP|nr:unnamed protein product [Pieris macdunnoughi]
MLIHLAIVFSLLAFTKSLNEGDKCFKTDGSPGVCKAINDCPYAEDDFRKNLEPMKCGISDIYSVICCGESLVVTTPKIKGRNTTTTEGPKAKEFSLECNKPERIGRKAYTKCLEYQEKYVSTCSAAPGNIMPIVGGQDAQEGEFPHMALLGYGKDKLEWICGGFIISEEFVVTAGHCTYSPYHGPVKKIRVGILRRSDPVDASKEYNVYPIKYPQYHSPMRYHDIALLRTDRIMQFNKFVMPACLHDGDESQTDAIVTGWGTTVFRHQELPDVLQKATVERFQNGECQELYRKTRLMPKGFNSTTQLCYGSRGSNQDTCEGDSGGPLQVSHPIVCCMHWVFGITSWGKWCGIAGEPSIYTRLQYYLPWIEEVVWPI